MIFHSHVSLPEGNQHFPCRIKARSWGAPKCKLNTHIISYLAYGFAKFGTPKISNGSSPQKIWGEFLPPESMRTGGLFRPSDPGETSYRRSSPHQSRPCREWVQIEGPLGQKKPGATWGSRVSPLITGVITITRLLSGMSHQGVLTIQFVYGILTYDLYPETTGIGSGKKKWRAFSRKHHVQISRNLNMWQKPL